RPVSGAGAAIFVSYRREDAGDAGRLGDWLGTHFGPERVFTDQTGLRPPDPFPAVLSEAIPRASAGVALVTPRWHAGLDAPDDWVRRELREALEAGRPVIPVLLHGAAPPDWAAQAPELEALAGTQVAVINDADYRDDVRRLVEALERYVPAGVPDAFPEIQAGSARAERRAAWWVADDPAHVRQRLTAVLAQHGISLADEDGDTELLRGGHKVKTRLFGALTG